MLPNHRRRPRIYATTPEIMSSSKRKPMRHREAEGWRVVAVLGIMAAIALTQYRRSPKNARALGDRRCGKSGPEKEHGADDRGRDARTPSEIPPRGWRDVLWRVYANIGDHRVLALAAGVTYYSILAIFPAIAALVAIYGLFSDPASIAKHLDQISNIAPGGAIEIAREQLTRVSSKGEKALGLTFLVSLTVSLWSANAAMKSLFDTLNIIYGEREKRSFLKLNALTMAFTIAAIAFLLAALGVLAILPVVLKHLWLSNAADLLIRIIRWPAMLVVVTLALACLYRVGPSREAPRWRWITWGSIAAAIAWLSASGLFSWYVANFGEFNETYGSLGAAVGFMTWLWISAIVILLGAEINAEMEHQTAIDSTTGHPKPIGARGAVVADSLGAPQ